MAFNVRQAGSHDLKQLLEWTIKLHQHENKDPLELHEDFESNLLKWLNNCLQNNNALTIVVEEIFEPALSAPYSPLRNLDDSPEPSHQRLPVGFLLGELNLSGEGFLKNPITGFIRAIWVNEEYRKYKLASQLLQQFEESAKASGAATLSCEYTQSNELAEKFWKTNGFAISAHICRKNI